MLPYQATVTGRAMLDLPIFNEETYIASGIVNRYLIVFKADRRRGRVVRATRL